jgi:predicted negative regulator of RcsB-dependent stress response
MAEDNSKVPVATLEYEPTSFEQALIKHKSKLILVGVLAVAGAVGYGTWRLVRESGHNAAALAFTRANSVDDLKKVASEYANQSAGGNALIFAADKLFADSKNADAIALLKDFLSKYPEHPLRDLASWRLAEYLAAGGNTEAAAAEYETIGQGNTPYSALALLRAGDIKWGAGEMEKARDHYDKILRNPAMAGSPARAKAQERMDKDLKTKPPVLVEYEAPLLPPAKLGSGGPTPGAGNLPPSLSIDEPFTPPVPGVKPINSPSLLDDAPPADSTPPPSLDGSQDNKGAAGDQP